MHLNKSIAVLATLWLALSLLACAGDVSNTQPAATEPIVYLKNNIHGTEGGRGGTRQIRASYANYVGEYRNHAIVPVNTAVRIAQVKNSSITMTGVADGTQIVIDYNAQNMAPVSAEDYVGYITAPNPVSLGNLSRIDQKGIMDGKAYVGMSKDAVRMALGYPALHKTPSLKDNTWTYWRNRVVMIVVEFDDSGTVRSVR